jgi:hypothetical protein
MNIKTIQTEADFAPIADFLALVSEVAELRAIIEAGGGGGGIPSGAVLFNGSPLTLGGATVTFS